MARGHDDGLALVQCEIHAVNRDSAHAVEARHKGITARLVRADFLALVEGKERHAQGIVLCQRLADDLPRLIGNLIFQRQDRCRFHILDTVHENSSCSDMLSVPHFCRSLPLEKQQTARFTDKRRTQSGAPPALYPYEAVTG